MIIIVIPFIILEGASVLLLANCQWHILLFAQIVFCVCRIHHCCKYCCDYFRCPLSSGRLIWRIGYGTVALSTHHLRHGQAPCLNLSIFMHLALLLLQENQESCLPKWMSTLLMLCFLDLEQCPSKFDNMIDHRRRKLSHTTWWIQNTMVLQRASSPHPWCQGSYGHGTWFWRPTLSSADQSCLLPWSCRYSITTIGTGYKSAPSS